MQQRRASGEHLGSTVFALRVARASIPAAVAVARLLAIHAMACAQHARAGRMHRGDRLLCARGLRGALAAVGGFPLAVFPHSGTAPRCKTDTHCLQVVHLTGGARGWDSPKLHRHSNLIPTDALLFGGAAVVDCGADCALGAAIHTVRGGRRPLGKRG